MKQAIFYYLNKTIPNQSFGVMAMFLAIRGRIKCFFPNLEEKVYADNVTLRVAMDKFMSIFLDRETLGNQSKCEELKKDMVKCYYLYGINPNEYFLHRFFEKDRHLRKTYLSKRDKNIYLRLAEGTKQNPINQLSDKGKFFDMAKDWFRRDVCIVKSKNDKERYDTFVSNNSSFIAKPISGSWGDGCKIFNNSDSIVFEDLISRGGYILEELIIQDDRIASWNETSVNTVRICSFRKKNGTIEQAFPFFKTGRKGSIVDNAGQGGVYASVDAKTGRISTDGMDESGNTYLKHPDSGIIFKGWQIPDWDKLVEISKQIHQSLPHGQKYVGFDFALSKEKGWVVVEGNWGDFICQQSSLRRGLRKEIMKLYKEMA